MPPSDPYIGKEILGQFRILERIGSGGMGSVYKAEQPAMDRLVAVKILHPKLASRKDLVSRFRREARAMSHLTHPNTVRVFLYGQLDDSSLYIVMEFLEGHNLGRLLRNEGPMAAQRAAAILIQACGALDEAHRAGIVHRDLKPENIFLTEQGGIRDFAKVLDFGLAKVTEREMQPGSLILTQEGMVFGTPEFMSPEQAQGKTLDPRSDLYSLGVILYELVTNKLPFDAKTSMEFIGLHVQSKPIAVAQRRPGTEFPDHLQPLLDRVLAKDPNDRYQTAIEFAAALKTLLPRDGYTTAMRMVPAAGASGGADRAASSSKRPAVGSAAPKPGPRPGQKPGQEPGSIAATADAGSDVAPQSIAALGAAVRDTAPASTRTWLWLGGAAVLAVGAAVAIAVALTGSSRPPARTEFAPIRLDPVRPVAADLPSGCDRLVTGQIQSQARECAARHPAPGAPFAMEARYIPQGTAGGQVLLGFGTLANHDAFKQCIQSYFSDMKIAAGNDACMVRVPYPPGAVLP